MIIDFVSYKLSDVRKHEINYLDRRPYANVWEVKKQRRNAEGGIFRSNTTRTSRITKNVTISETCFEATRRAELHFRLITLDFELYSDRLYNDYNMINYLN